jgi:DNA-binding helix-hairpin-helix protein with protein kinase domain
MRLLERGQVLHTERTQQAVTVDNFIGDGGEGEVYECEFGGKRVAVKWYFENVATTEKREILHQLTHEGAPSPRFLWPQEIVLLKTAPNSFGYLMKLREKRFYSISALMDRVIDPSFESLVTAAYNTADEFSKLHSKGFCYRDISFGNIFFDPDTGEIAICDNDNVVINNRGNVTVRGTPRFMAPEIVTGRSQPNIQTDEFSLAVLLFYLLFTHHPFQGAMDVSIHALDAPAMNFLYGENPVFIFDPADDRNRPIPGIHDNPIIFWNIYPEILKRLFIRSFTNGIRGRRLAATYWRSELMRTKGLIFRCQVCRSENFYDPELAQSYDQGERLCWQCGRALERPLVLVQGNIRLTLQPGKVVSTQQFPLANIARTLDDKKIAEVCSHPTQPGLLGLTNFSANPWTVLFPDRDPHVLNPGQTTLIYEGVKIKSGNLEWEIS